MARTLVVYYSRTGTTARVAVQLAAMLGADVDVITERRSRRGLGGYLRSAFEATMHRSPELAAPLRDPGAYEMVVVGSPTWGASVCSPVRAYLRQQGAKIHAAAFFSTCGGRGGERVLEQMAEVWGGKPVATLALRQSPVDAGESEGDIRAFADQVEMALAVPVAAPREAA